MFIAYPRMFSKFPVCPPYCSSPSFTPFLLSQWKPIKAQACFFANPIGATHHTAVVHHLQLYYSSNARLGHGGTGSLHMQPPWPARYARYPLRLIPTKGRGQRHHASLRVITSLRNVPWKLSIEPGQVVPLRFVVGAPRSLS